jgi:hypothetical protein
MRAGVLALMVFLIAAPVGAASDGCELRQPTFTEAVNTDGVVGVVERTTLARNPLPWGSSVSVATGIWGDIVAERWVVSARALASCSRSPVFDAGTISYDFRGSTAQWGDTYAQIWGAAPVEESEEVLLAAAFGELRTFDIGSGDRVMAWVRVASTEMILVLAIAGALVTAAIRRSRVRHTDPHLF